MLAWDTETEAIREVRLAPPLACVTFSDGERSELIHHADPAAKRCVQWLLEQETTLANAPFDLAVVWAYFPDLRDLVWEAVYSGRIHDVLMRQKLLDLGAGCYRRTYRRLPGEEKTTLLGYSLSDTHARYYKVRMEKDTWRLRYGELRGLPLEQWPEGARRYATYDAEVTARIYDLQSVEAQRTTKHNLHNEIAQVQAHFALHLMSCWGFKTDLKRVEQVIAEIDKETPALIERLRKVDLVRPKGGKPHVRNEKLAKQMMYAAVGDAGELTVTGYKKVKAGEMNKDEALRAGYIKIDEEWCEISGYAALVDYYHFRQNQLLKTKLGHIHIAAKYGLPVQTSFEPLMETGRTSSRENKTLRNSMALQNPPRKGGMRSCFTARPGCTLISADYGQAELVSLAQVTYALCGYSKMRDLINSNMDLHVDFAKEIIAVERGIRMDYADAFKLYKSENPYMEDRRNLAKGFNFGKPGGLGAASFQSYVRKGWGIDITFEQSRTLGYAWLDHFEEMRPYFRWISDMIEQGGGRVDIQQYMTGRWRGKCYYTQAANTLFQGLTADAAKAALFEVSRHCYAVKSSALYGCRPVLFVHDEIITEAPREQANEAAKEQERIMVDVYQRYTPDVKITAEAHLMDSWYKEAKAQYDERGKLIPWDPPQDEDERFEEGTLAA
jgi:DNA polymerase I